MDKWTGPDINILFGINLKRLRLRRNMSQLSLANSAGLTHNFINEIENGRKWVSPETIAKLTEALDISPYELLLSASNGNTNIDLINEYLDDIASNFQKMVHDIRTQYSAGRSSRDSS